VIICHDMKVVWKGLVGHGESLKLVGLVCGEKLGLIEWNEET
jgi:hypothetical protein